MTQHFLSSCQYYGLPLLTSLLAVMPASFKFGLLEKPNSTRSLRQYRRGILSLNEASAVVLVYNR
jgi:hypothetical protein